MALLSIFLEIQLPNIHYNKSKIIHITDSISYQGDYCTEY